MIDPCVYAVVIMETKDSREANQLLYTVQRYLRASNLSIMGGAGVACVNGSGNSIRVVGDVRKMRRAGSDREPSAK
jgi:hypothetical protein